MTTPLCTRQRSPIEQPAPRVTRGAVRRCADARAGTDEAVRVDDRLRAHAGVRLDDDARPDACRAIDLGARVDERAGVDAGRLRRTHAPHPPLREPCEVEVGVRGYDRGAARERRLALLGRDDHAGGLRRRELRLIARIGQKRQRRRGRGLQRADAGDAQTGVAGQLAAECRGNLAQRYIAHITWRRQVARSAP